MSDIKTIRIFNLYVNPGIDQEDIMFMAGAVKKAYETIKTNSNNG